MTHYEELRRQGTNDVMPRGGDAISRQRTHKSHDELVQDDSIQKTQRDSHHFCCHPRMAWLHIGSDPMPENIRFISIPNVIPSEREKAGDFPRFYEAVMTKMEDPFEKLLDQLEPPVRAIIGDVELRWPTAVGRRRNIPVASLWTMSASFFSMLHHLQIFTRDRPLSADLVGKYYMQLSLFELLSEFDNLFLCFISIGEKN